MAALQHTRNTGNSGMDHEADKGRAPQGEQESLTASLWAHVSDGRLPPGTLAGHHTSSRQGQASFVPSASLVVTIVGPGLPNCKLPAACCAERASLSPRRGNAQLLPSSQAPVLHAEPQGGKPTPACVLPQRQTPDLPVSVERQTLLPQAAPVAGSIPEAAMPAEAQV